MTVLGTDVLLEAMGKHADLRGPGASWLKIASAARWKSLVEVRKTWRDTDFIDPETCFNVKGNRYRLWALVNYGAQTIIITRIETHAQYGKKKV